MKCSGRPRKLNIKTVTRLRNRVNGKVHTVQNMYATDYLKVLKKHARTLGNRLVCKWFVFWVDDDPKHTARCAKKLFGRILRGFTRYCVVSVPLIILHRSAGFKKKPLPRCTIVRGEYRQFPSRRYCRAGNTYSRSATCVLRFVLSRRDYWTSQHLSEP